MLSSIRTKLTLLYLSILAASILAFAAVMYYAILRSVDRDLNLRLVEMSNNFATALSAEEADSKDNASREAAVVETVGEMKFRDYQFIVYSQDGRVIASSPDLKLPLEGYQDSGRFQDINIAENAFRLYRTPIQVGGANLLLIVVHSLSERAEMGRRLGQIFLIGIPLTLIVASFCGYLLARRSLTPMVEMGKQAGQISARNLSERLGVRNEHDELGQLASVFNDLLGRLDEAFKQQRRFMADASHELRTPLAIVRGEAEVALSRSDRPTGDYRESLAIVHDESKRLTKIVEDLFMLARADAGQFQVNFAQVYLDDVVSDTVRAINVLARAKNIRVDVSTNGEMPIRADESLLRRLFLNLLDNAVKYSRAGGTVSIKSETTDTNYVLRITDTGSGIPIDQQQHIFERFYRVDKSRGHSQDSGTGGAGLGLAISRWIAEIHGGRIDLVSSGENGSVFSVTFRR